jgi:hypothetical protein
MGTPSRFIVALDSGALIALSRGNREARGTVLAWSSRGAEFIIPTPVLTETLRGGAGDAAVNWVIRRSDAEVAELSSKSARRAGELLGAARAKPLHAIDAMIVSIAMESGARDILTSDPDDLRLLSNGKVNIEPI